MQFLPVPRFLKPTIYGFDISDVSYKFIALQNACDGTRLLDFGEGAVPPGAIQNGEIRNRNALLQTLRDVFRTHHIQFVALSLPDERGFTRSLKLAKTSVKKEEIGQTLILQLDEHIPLPPNDVVFDYTIASEEKDHFDIVLRALPRVLVESYCGVIKEAGVLPVLVEPEWGAIARAIISSKFPEPIVVLDVGRLHSSVAIFNQGVLRFSATIAVGNNMLIEALAKYFNVRFEEALHFKEKKENFLQALIPVLKLLRDEVQKYIEYWNQRAENATKLKQIFIIGGHAHLPGLTDYFSSELNLHVLHTNPWVTVKFPSNYIPKLSLQDSVRFVSAIGLWLKASDEEIWL